MRFLPNKEIAMLDRRATRVVWIFLSGVTVLEGWLLWVSFRGRDVDALWRYASKPATASAWIAAAMVAAVYAAYSASASPMIRAHMLRASTWRPYAAIRLLAIPMALVTGYFEEALFRKTLMDAAFNHGASIAVQIALSALVFGAAHAIWGVLAGNLRGAAGAMLATAALGAALGTVYVLGGRNVGPCIAAHIAINLLIEPWLIITAATNGWRTPPIRGSAAA
jgi:CAAX protease family protein